MYVPKLVLKANQMAAGSLSRTAGMQGSSETSVSSRIQPRSPTPVGIGIPAAMLSLEWTYCNCFLKISELSKPDSFLWMGINLLVVVLTCCKESKTPTATDSYYHVWRCRIVHGSPHDGALNVLISQFSVEWMWMTMDRLIRVVNLVVRGCIAYTAHYLYLYKGSN
jgi:hypothetical protein